MHYKLVFPSFATLISVKYQMYANIPININSIIILRKHFCRMHFRYLFMRSDPSIFTSSGISIFHMQNQLLSEKTKVIPSFVNLITKFVISANNTCINCYTNITVNMAIFALLSDLSWPRGFFLIPFIYNLSVSFLKNQIFESLPLIAFYSDYILSDSHFLAILKFNIPQVKFFQRFHQFMF